MNIELAVNVNRVTKTFFGKEVLRECSMHVKKGSIYGLLGINGAGKTTLFKIITGLMSVTNGSVDVLNNAVSLGCNEQLKHMGILINTPVFYEHLSAKENIEIHLEYMGMNNTNIDNVLKMVGLTDTNSQPVSEFSLGMRQRLAIARAISHSPEILILDEPLNGLDPIGIMEMRKLFHELADRNMTILVASHILHEIEQTVDTVGIINNGTIVKELSIKEIDEEYPDGLEEFFYHTVEGGHYEKIN